MYQHSTPLAILAPERHDRQNIRPRPNQPSALQHAPRNQRRSASLRPQAPDMYCTSIIRDHCVCTKSYLQTFKDAVLAGTQVERRAACHDMVLAARAS